MILILSFRSFLMDAGKGFCELEMQMYDKVGPRGTKCSFKKA